MFTFYRRTAYKGNVKYNDRSIPVTFYVSEGLSSLRHQQLGKGSSVTFSPKFVFLFPAEWVDVKYCLPVSDKENSPEEIAAAIKIQAMWRGTYVRLLMKARTPGINFHHL